MRGRLRYGVLAFAAMTLAACSGTPSEDSRQDDGLDGNLSSGFTFARNLDLMGSQAEVTDWFAAAKGNMDSSKYAAAVFSGKGGSAIKFDGEVSYGWVHSYKATTLLFGWKGPAGCSEAAPLTDGGGNVNDGKNWGLLSSLKSDERVRPFTLPRTGRYMVLVTSEPGAYENKVSYRLFVRSAVIDPALPPIANATAEGLVACNDGKKLSGGLVVGLDGEEVPVGADGRFALRSKHIPDFYTAWVRNTNLPEQNSFDHHNPMQLPATLMPGPNPLLFLIQCY